VVGDVYADFFGTSDKEWRTVLVVGERQGGEAYVALDITSGEDFDSANADPATFLWEFADDGRLGQTWADPSIDLVTTDSAMPAWCWWCDAANDPTWGVFFGSGYASTAIAQKTKEAYLYGLTVQDAGPLWKDAAGDPTNRIKLADGNKIDYEDEEDPFSVSENIIGQSSGATATVVAVTPSGDTGTLTLTNVSGTFQNGEVLIGGSGGEAEVNGTLYGGLANNALGAVLMVDMEGDYISDRIYAGDLYGNMYRVTDIGKNQSPQVSTLFTYNNSSPNINPIRARASFAYGKTPGDIWLYFGSGRFEETTDKMNGELQYFFGLRDGSTPRTPAYETDELVTLRPFFASIDVDGESERVRVIDGTNPTAASWKLELYNGQAAYSGPAIVGSERVITQPLVVGGIVFFSTFIPDADVCDGGGETWVFALDYDTGMAATEPVFDIDGDGLFDVNDMVEDGGETKVPVAINVGRPPPPPPPPPINLPDYRVVLDSWRQN
jgi:Tfp pilus tip-associated adhesin PilY1